MSKVVVVKHHFDQSRGQLTQQEYELLLSVGLRALSGETSVKVALRKYVRSGVVGMKANCITGKPFSTSVALADALCRLLVEAGFPENNLVVWDRTSRELKNAGFTLNASARQRRCLGTDAAGFGYGETFYTSGQVNSLVSTILADLVDFNINLPVLRDHSIAGLCGGLKNMYGAIHNPNKYHGNNCDPYCAHVSNLEPLKSKNRLTILDAARVQYHGGPGFVERFIFNYGGIVISDDPVAADSVGLEILEHLRAAHGQPPVAKSGRPANYLKSAEALGLGTADISRIVVQVIGVDANGKETPEALD